MQPRRIHDLSTRFTALARGGFLASALATPLAARWEKRVSERADALIEEFGLAGLAERQVGELPFGTKKRVELARALACLERFGQRLRDMHADSVRVVGTNALRMAHRKQAFLERAREALGHPIEIIAGMEEARLIYSGVAHTMPNEAGKRLVIDIGGGSTEIIIGERYEPLELESLQMGCVSLSQRYFGDGRLSAKRIERVLTNDTASGVMRHADAGYEAAIECAREHGLDLPMLE